MSLDPLHFVHSFSEANKPIFKQFRLAQWEAATCGTGQALAQARVAQEIYQRFLADPHLFASARRVSASHPGDDTLARQLELICLLLAKHQQDEAGIGRTTRLESEIRLVYYNYRPVLEGRAVSDNELDAILQSTDDSDLAQSAWEASKQVGELAADRIRQLAHARNAAARTQGYRDHFERSLRLSEIEAQPLFDLLDQLARQTDAPYGRIKALLDEQQAAWFGIAPARLRPWHYGDRFFQDARQRTPMDLERRLAVRDPLDLATRFYAGFGMDVRDVIARSDLFERPGKKQQAFCMHIDREGDIRVLSNLRPNWRWNQTLLHELGHAAYEKYLDYTLPWLLRTPAHLMCSEALANFMTSRMVDERWLKGVLGLDPASAARRARETLRLKRIQRLIFVRWALVVIHFEQQLYADPDQDLNGLWWDLVERFQRLTRIEGRDHPDWAAKYHIALVPVYYQNYVLGYLTTAQLEALLQRLGGGQIDYAAAGPWLVENFIRPGARRNWHNHVSAVTGEPLTPRHLLDTFAEL